MNRFVVDASIAIKWVITEPGTPEALALLDERLAAPDLLTVECANILWKKVQRNELSPDEALMAARVLQQADIEIYAMRQLLDVATQLAIDLAHPAYDCAYLALALSHEGWRLVTADDRFLRKLRQSGQSPYRDSVISLAEAASEISTHKK